MSLIESDFPICNHCTYIIIIIIEMKMKIDAEKYEQRINKYFNKENQNYNQNDNSSKIYILIK